MYKIMIVEDDVNLRNLVADTFRKYGWTTVEVDDFLCVEEIFDKESPDIVILDINLTYYDGFYYCRVFRRKSTVPIIIVSSRDDEANQILGMELGADDYIVKPVNLEILIAKVNAIMRRNYGEYSSKEIAKKSLIELNERTFKITYQEKSEELSKNEFKLVKKLLEKEGEIVSREELLIELWDDYKFVADNTLTLNVTRVKSKLDRLGIRDAIKTKRGVGYVFQLT